MSNRTPYELETLFIDKLTEKYKLNERDLKKAFAQYDTDGNGLLDLSEITGAIQLYLNGISKAEIQQFVKHYDLNGDGLISFEEFFTFLTKRNAVPKTAAKSNKPMVVPEEPARPVSDHRRRREPEQGRRGHRAEERKREKWDFNHDTAPAPQRVGVVNAWDETAYGDRSSGEGRSRRRPPPSEVSDASRFDPTDEHSVVIRARRFVQNVRALETKRSMAVRMQDTSYDKHSAQLNEILDKISRAHVVGSLDQYLHDDDESRTSGIKYRDFCRVMRRYKFPGVDEVRDEVLLYIYQLVCVRGGANFSNIQMSLMDPRTFAMLLFPPRKTRNAHKNSGTFKAAELLPSVPDGVFDLEDTVVGDPHGGSSSLERAVGHMDLNETSGTTHPRPVGERKKSLARGPIRNQNESGLPMHLEPSDLPSKFQSRKVHNTLKAPFDFDPGTVTKSAQLPAASLSFDYVFGLRTDFHSGSAIYGSQLQGTRARLEGRNDPFVAVYATAALGVVHRLDSNTQSYFNAHSDDISCIALSPDGAYVATGQIGKYPECYIWSVQDPSSGPIARIGSEKFFSRAVCSVCFSYDSEYLMAMSCDDRHSMGIFKISSGVMVCETVAGNGVPPQIRSSTWCSTPQATAFISTSHASGRNDLFVTAGERTLKLWSFRRPVRVGGSAEQPASILCSNAIMGRGSKGNSKFPVDHAPIYYCTAFIQQPDDGTGGSLNKNDDLVSGGSNGYVYLWIGQECAQVLKVSTSPVRALQVIGVFILVGCDSGVVKILQGNLVQVAAITVSHSSLFNDISARPNSGHSGGNMRSTSTGRSMIRPASGGAKPISTNRNLRAGTRPASKSGSRDRQFQGAKKEKFSARELEALGDAATWSRLDVIGIAYLGHEDEGTNTMAPVSRSGAVLSENSASGGTYMPPMFSGDMLVVTSSGQCFKIYAEPLAAGGRSGTPRSKRSSAAGSREVNASLSPELLFYFHVGPIWAVATKGDIIATGGDDKWICLWSIESHRLIGRFLSHGAIRCINFDHTGHAIAIGLTSGTVSVFSLDYSLASKLAASTSHANFPALMRRIASRKDAAEEISDAKFNPTGTMLAVGSHDNYIYLYDCGFAPSSGVPTECDLKLLRRLKGHSSYITHLDWSIDGRLIQSNCGAYEILYWDAMSGRQFLFRTGENASNTKWKTETCVLGFAVMGIWPMYSDGTDVNAVDVSRDHKLIVTGGDNGMVTLFNYPCVVKNPPSLEYKAHSSHVLCTRFAKNDTRVVSVGGNDECVVLWKVRKSSGMR